MAFKCSSQEYTLIPLSNLIFDERVADMVETNGMEFPETLLNNINAMDTFALVKKRLVRILCGYKTGLPPIKVKKQPGGILHSFN